MTDLHKELERRAFTYLFNKGYWTVGNEVRMPVGICDAWGMKHYGGFESMAIEVKVSRNDFKSKSQIYKENIPFPLGNYQYVLCPDGLIKTHEVHKEWGLLWWDGKRMLNKKQAPRLEMSAGQKLEVLVYFLDNGVNVRRPKLLVDKEVT